MICNENFTNECGIYFEHSVDYKGKAYLVIYGYHAGGNFVFFPSQLRGCEIENDFQPISQKIIATGIKAEFATEVENYIEQWKASNPEEVQRIALKKIENAILQAEKNNRFTL